MKTASWAAHVFSCSEDGCVALRSKPCVFTLLTLSHAFSTHRTPACRTARWSAGRTPPRTFCLASWECSLYWRYCCWVGVPPCSTHSWRSGRMDGWMGGWMEGVGTVCGAARCEVNGWMDGWMEDRSLLGRYGEGLIDGASLLGAPLITPWC